MDPLRRDDIERAQRTPPAEKLLQALQMMAEGITLKRARLRAVDAAASEEEIDARLLRWMLREP